MNIVEAIKIAKSIGLGLDDVLVPAIKIGTQWRFNQNLIDKWLEQQANDLSTSIQSHEKHQESEHG